MDVRIVNVSYPKDGISEKVFTYLDEESECRVEGFCIKNSPYMLIRMRCVVCNTIIAEHMDDCDLNTESEAFAQSGLNDRRLLDEHRQKNHAKAAGASA